MASKSGKKKTTTTKKAPSAARKAGGNNNHKATTSPARKTAAKSTKPASSPSAAKTKKPAAKSTETTAAGGGNHSGRGNKFMTAKELELFRKLLLELRDRVTDEITFLTGDNLNRSQRDASGDLSNYGLHMADHGTDNFDREFALSLMSSEQDILYEIDEALRRVDNGTYGICEHSGEPIEKERLKILPHARFCVTVQSEFERSRSRARPMTSRRLLEDDSSPDE